MEEQVGGGQVALAFMQQQQQALPRAHNPAPAICPPANSTPATPRHTQRPHQLIWDNYKWAMVTHKLEYLTHICTLGLLLEKSLLFSLDP